jgi:pseudaminic acid cytidylyltransferase
MSAIAIIPARGGSVRLPRKNMVPFLGRPIIAYTIEAALTSGLFDSVVVSTEDAEIEMVARQYGAAVHARPRHLATSTATVVEVCLDLLSAEEKAGRAYEKLCCLYATAPLRSADDIRAVFGLLQRGDCDFSFAMTTFPFPPQQAMRLDGEGRLRAMWPEQMDLRSSEIGTLVVDNGSTYAAYVDAFRREKSFLGSTSRGYMMPRLRSVDIDEAEDLEAALIYAREAKTS